MRERVPLCSLRTQSAFAVAARASGDGPIGQGWWQGSETVAVTWFDGPSMRTTVPARLLATQIVLPLTATPEGPCPGSRIVATTFSDAVSTRTIASSQ